MSMSELELKEKLDEIREGMKLFDSIVRVVDYETGEGKLTEKQVVIVNKLFDLFRSLNWQLSFNKYKELKYTDTKPIDTRKCGSPVKVRSCRKEHGDKTYFGILLGNVALSISHSIDDDGNVVASHSRYNPAIFVPELNDIIYGCESWWGRIESEDDLKEITDDLINDIWYVKALNRLTE